MLDGYEKIKTVGKGAFGTATLYRRIKDNKHVVIKEIFTMDMDDEEKETASNEVEIISTLNHPNIIRYLGSIQKSDALLIIMEFADGGNLAQLINSKKNKKDFFTEKGILNIISQISSALTYMHACKILHRDLKTANVFINVDGTIKVGDFGISKIMTTKSQAQTVVGTPYYLSPEMCEGHAYNDKSDVWALGCILYELACLKKPFDGPNLPVLVKRIIACEYENIPSIYSDDLQKLVFRILQKNPVDRPSAKYIWESILPTIANKNKMNFEKSKLFNDSMPKERSILYELKDFGDDIEMTPIDLPLKKIIDISTSNNHTIIVTADNDVYAWGDNKFGQLGLGFKDSQRKYPVCVTYLSDKHIIRCAAGDGFSLFLSHYGYVFSCGDGTYGCLGHGNYNNILIPTLINTLTSIKITQISSGFHHAGGISSEGRIYTWGTSLNGETGQGIREQSTKPISINLPMKIKQIYCFHHATFLLTIKGEILVCGKNNYNKLGISDQPFLRTFQTSSLTNVANISMGQNHVVIVKTNGEVIGMGNNEKYQLGKTDCKAQGFFKIKMDGVIRMCSCGPNFTTVVDNKNVVWFWGSYERSKECSSSRSMDHRQNHCRTNLCDSEKSNEAKMVKEPKSILALYSSKNNTKNGNYIQIGNIVCKESTLLILVHSTTPPAVKMFDEFDSQNKNFVSQSLNQSEFQTELPNTPTWN